MILDTIKEAMSSALMEQRRKALTGVELQALFANLTPAQWNKLAQFVVNNAAQELGDFQIKGVKAILKNQADLDIEQIWSDGSLSIDDINALFPLA